MQVKFPFKTPSMYNKKPVSANDLISRALNRPRELENARIAEKLRIKTTKQ